jgi:hypothetical protein
MGSIYSEKGLNFHLLGSIYSEIAQSQPVNRGQLAPKQVKAALIKGVNLLRIRAGGPSHKGSISAEMTDEFYIFLVVFFTDLGGSK